VLNTEQSYRCQSVRYYSLIVATVLIAN